MATPAGLYIGLMSGTSMDGIDAVLVSPEASNLQLLASHTLDYPHGIHQRLLRATQNHATPDDIGELDHDIGALFAQCAMELLEKSGTSPASVSAIGSHGQTVRHQPRGRHPFSLQLGDPNLIVERTGIATVADFRRRDLAAGGEGAPLVPAFHRAFLGSPTEDRCIINVGGIANLTWLPADNSSKAIGFDTGPGNALMDAWCLDQTGRPYDEDGHWAAEGQVDQGLLADFLSEAYFTQTSPKSTGKEKFNLDWLHTFLARHGDVSPADVQRTLLELTVRTVIDQLPRASAMTVYVCGGGVRNPVFMDAFRKAAAPLSVCTTDEIGLSAQWVEATAFAWLAQQTMQGLPGNLPAVTGASGERILGAVYWP